MNETYSVLVFRTCNLTNPENGYFFYLYTKMYIKEPSIRKQNLRNYIFLLLLWGSLLFSSFEAYPQNDTLVILPDLASDSIPANRMIDTLYRETGIASFYAKKFEGRRCASGEMFKHSKLTAAHKTLKMGTWVKVTNLKNDSSVIVKINDRLPKRSKRCIDLTLKAARQLNFVNKGLTRVTIERLKITEQTPP